MNVEKNLRCQRKESQRTSYPTNQFHSRAERELMRLSEDQLARFYCNFYYNIAHISSLQKSFFCTNIEAYNRKWPYTQVVGSNKVKTYNKLRISTFHIFLTATQNFIETFTCKKTKNMCVWSFKWLSMFLVPQL